MLVWWIGVVIVLVACLWGWLSLRPSKLSYAGVTLLYDPMFGKHRVSNGSGAEIIILLHLGNVVTKTYVGEEQALEFMSNHGLGMFNKLQYASLEQYTFLTNDVSDSDLQKLHLERYTPDSAANILFLTCDVNGDGVTFIPPSI